MYMIGHEFSVLEFPFSYIVSVNGGHLYGFYIILIGCSLN